MTTNERLHHAVGMMTEEEAAAALRTLAEASGDPVAWVLDHAPLDDEPESGDERRAVAAARADRERGVMPVALQDVLAEFERGSCGWPLSQRPARPGHVWLDSSVAEMSSPYSASRSSRAARAWRSASNRWA